MRTVEVLFVIVILLSAFLITTYFAVLPSPSQAFGTNLRELSQSTLETLDADGVLSATVFEDPDDPAWADLQRALSASLPPNIVYNLNVYNLSTNSAGTVVDYELTNSISDASLGADSDASSLLVTSPDVTFIQNPQKVGESTGEPITLYILNCSDANGWWITGYTGQSLAADLYDLLSQYFETTVLLNSTAEFQDLLENSDSFGGTIDNAVVINTFGEAVPIPEDYADLYSGDYAEYCYFLGQTVNTYNWTWVSIVGYPFYYVTNVDYFTGTHNNYGIYGMSAVANAGANAFLRGLKNVDPYGGPVGTDIKAEVGVVDFTSYVLDRCNYYGIYPAPYQTSSRALSQSILTNYDLVATEIFDRPNDNPTTFTIDESTYIPAATYRHAAGALTAIGLTRIPDIRVAALGLLVYYNPTIYKTVFGASGTSVLVTLQLAQQGGI
jgi:hypothetical protein